MMSQASEQPSLGIPISRASAHRTDSRRLLIVILAPAVLVAACAAHLLLGGSSPLPEGRLTIDAAFTGSMLVTAACSAAFVLLIGLSDPLGGAAGGMFETSGLLRAFERCIVGGLFAGCTAIVTVFVLAPHRFSRWAAEDFVIETLSAAACLTAAVVFVIGGVLALRRAGADRTIMLQAGLLLGAGVVSAVIGLEEVSWFQRQLDIETPTAFAANQQNEMNVHNFATRAFEKAYYLAAFLFFVCVPYLASRTRLFGTASLQALVPGIAPFVAVAIACGYSYPNWTSFPTQLAFWLGSFVTLDLALRAKSREIRIGLWACLALLVVSQAAFLLRGHLQWAPWDVKEYREYLIAAAIVLYACEQVIARTVSSASRGSRAASPAASRASSGR